MKVLYNQSTDPAFNLALEEYILTQTQQDMILLWRNAPAVIIGINQNAWEEINFDFVKEKDITIIRRQSGGGAVFHDLGNINFTVIHPLGEEDFNNYQKFTQPIIDFLASLGVESELRGRNDLLIDGMKFSGNAQAVRGNRIMHHGTLLFSADFSHLSGALNPSEAKIQSKGIKSVRSRVTNIADHLPTPMRVEEFLTQLYDFYQHAGAEGGLAEYTLTAADLAEVENLVKEKYGTWKWNIGKSPSFAYKNSLRFSFGTVEVQLNTREGVIQDIKIFGDFFGTKDITEVEQALVGAPPTKEGIRKALEGVSLNGYVSGLTLEDFILLF